MIGDIEYGIAADELLLLDAYVPEGEGGDGPFPAAIVIHGGGWCSGDKRQDLPFLPALARAGFTCFSINYRLAPQHRWPACMEDVRGAIRWVKAHAEEYKADAERIALIGYSAGGHLALHAAATANDPAIAAVVGLAAPTDMVLDNFRRGGLSACMKDLLGREHVDHDTLETLWGISPINHLRPGLPPFLLVHGSEDQSVPYSQSLHLRQRLHAVNVSCDIVTLPGAPHRIAEWLKFDAQYPDKMAQWLHKVLCSSPQQSPVSA